MSLDRLNIQSIEAQQAVIGYDGEKSVFINEVFRPGNVYCIKGQKAKSAFLRVLCGLEFPMEGKLVINKMETKRMSFEEFLPLRLNIGYASGIGGLLSNRTLEDNLKLPLQYHRVYREKNLQEKINYIMERFELSHFANERPAGVPGWVRKLTCILRAFMLKPQVLVLDEISTGLKEESLRLLRDWIQQYCKEHPDVILFYTDEMNVFKNEFNAKEITLENNPLDFLEVA